jgi:hypothetical protein
MRPPCERLDDGIRRRTGSLRWRSRATVGEVVVDASVAVTASVTPVGFTRVREIERFAPPALSIEVVSRERGRRAPARLDD